MQARMYLYDYLFVTLLSRVNLFCCRNSVIMGYFGALERSYLIFYLITDQIIVSHYTMLSRSFA